MRLKIKGAKIEIVEPIAFIHPADAATLVLHPGDRAWLIAGRTRIVAEIDVASEMIKKGEIALSKSLLEQLGASSTLELVMAAPPKSISSILKKLKGKKLSKQEINNIIFDIANNVLSEAEIAFFVSGVYEKGMSLKETIYLTEAIYKTGVSLNWKSNLIADKHCIGGIAGNRTTPIVVAICAAAGLKMPKTSSRAITSAAGTADTVETLTNVNFETKELQRIVNKVGACIAWGGALGLAPADDKLIRVERLLNVDPESQLIASIMAKKLSAGSKYILIDIPYGKFAKVSLLRAKELKRKFEAVGRHFKLKLKVVLTDGSQPIGNGIGPILEMLDILRVLEQRDSPKDLEEKSVMLAGELLELVEKAKKGKGQFLAREILYTGRALKKFNEILDAQGRKPVILSPGPFSTNIFATQSGTVEGIDNVLINYLARHLGCPLDKSAGIYLYKHNGQFVAKGEKVMALFAETKHKLETGANFAQENKVFHIHNN